MASGEWSVRVERGRPRQTGTAGLTHQQSEVVRGMEARGLNLMNPGGAPLLHLYRLARLRGLVDRADGGDGVGSKACHRRVNSEENSRIENAGGD